jgi:hypothetical protein
MPAKIQIGITSAILLLLVIITGCKKSDHFINANSLPTGTYYYPVVLNTLTDSTDAAVLNGHYYNPGDTVTFELDFYSQDPVSTIDLQAILAGKSDTVDSIPYTGALYSVQKEADTAMLQYIIPGDAKSGETAGLNVFIYTANQLYTTTSAIIHIR